MHTNCVTSSCLPCECATFHVDSVRLKRVFVRIIVSGDSVNCNHLLFFQTVGTLQSLIEGYVFEAQGLWTEGSRTTFSEGRKSQNRENELCAVLAPRAGESIKQANRMLI